MEYNNFLVHADTDKFKADNRNYGQDESWHFTHQGADNINDSKEICVSRSNGQMTIDSNTREKNNSS